MEEKPREEELQANVHGVTAGKREALDEKWRRQNQAIELKEAKVTTETL